MACSSHGDLQAQLAVRAAPAKLIGAALGWQAFYKRTIQAMKACLGFQHNCGLKPDRMNVNGNL
jgi:hypothetical protein